MRNITLVILSVLSLQAGAQGYLRASGQKIVDGNNKEIILRGIGLGGWMLQEPYMMKLSGAAVAQYDIRKKFIDLVGIKNTDLFYEAWLQNHCTKADIDSLAAWGFNSVRLPMHYNLYTLPIELEPVKGKNTWLAKGFQLTDSLVRWCRLNKIYLILDLHAAPGGQGNDNAISDRDASLPSLWESEENKNKTIALWQQLANRYKKEKWIGGYDLINEPNWGFRPGENINGCDEKENGPLIQLQKDITSAIRKIDPHHMIFIEGNCWGNNYNGMSGLWAKNLVMSFHKYWNYNDKASIQKFLDYRDKFNIPIWLGETGENSNAWFTDMIRLLEQYRIGWAMWPLKKSGLNNPAQVRINEGYQGILDHLEGKTRPPLPDMATRALMEYAANTNIKNNIIHHSVVDAMFRQVKSTEPVPFRQHIIQAGAILFAADYDMGRSGSSYHDVDSAEYWVSTNLRTPWNIGGKYRNDGVDIEACTDIVSNGYHVGWIQTGEWMQYSIYAPSTAVFDVNIRSAAKENTGRLKLLINNKATQELPIPANGERQWTTNTIKNIKLNKGWNRIRVLAIAGGFNLNYFQFIPGGNTDRLK